jgi:hypothetical protein
MRIPLKNALALKPTLSLTVAIVGVIQNLGNGDQNMKKLGSMNGVIPPASR